MLKSKPGAAGLHRPRIATRGVLAILVTAIAVAAPGLARGETGARANPLVYPAFTGSPYGVASGQGPVGADFSFTCNVHASGAAISVASHAVAAGAGITNVDNCGQGYLFLDAPGAGHFRATIALADDATIASGGAPEARIFVLGSNGYTSRSEDILLAKGIAKAIDVDVAGAVTIAFTFPNGAPTYIYDMHLTNAVQMRHLTPLVGGGIAVGGKAVAASQLSFDCNAHPTITAESVSHVTVPPAAAVQLTACSTATVKLPSGSSGTLAMRFGASDGSDYTSVPTVFAVRVLDGSGHLLRKAVGLAFLGGGLQPIWINVSGGASVTLTMDTSTAALEIAGLALLPGQYKLHPNPDHNEFGSPTGALVSIVPEAFAIDCNAHPGADDITVNRAIVVRDTYLYGTDCGVASLVMTNARGSFHALVGVDDATSPQRSGMVKLTVLDQNGHPLFTRSTRATIGKPSMPLDAKITGGSIVKLEITGPVVIYDLQLSGRATFYDRVFPPSEPPTSIKGGIALNPLAFSVDCNTSVSKLDILLLHAAALEQWALDGQRCGTATLNVATLQGAHAVFGGRYGLSAADQRLKLGHVLVRVLGPSGKVLRAITLTAREGYGPAPFVISLAGAAKLVLSWPEQRVIVFAMTLA
jgi:hypothetical protein